MKKTGYVLLLFGVCFMAVSTFSVFEAVDILNRSVQTSAVVLYLRWDYYGVSSAVFPILRFVDAQGVEHIAEAQAGSGIFVPRVGEEWNMWYDPANPEGVFFTHSDVWVFPTLFLALSFCPLIAGLILLRII